MGMVRIGANDMSEHIEEDTEQVDWVALIDSANKLIELSIIIKGEK